ncbi:pilin [Psychrobacter sp. SWN149]|uniref:pilin n=1 Tax=Psychrobacter sp. SWN149 TaxID=2792057 RepID=UPI0018CD124D|nr:pilin [Psychrobacter sp. SWN149]MBH0005216.1 pilin [Psychrobacter sp. SWN149]
MNANIQKGFTLIELMIVVAIIGILAAIAIPQYQNYIAKSQVSRAMGETSSVKTAVETCLNEGKGAKGACPLGITTSNIQATTVVGKAPDANGNNDEALIEATPIVATFGTGAAKTLQEANKNTLTWTRDAAGSWTCTTKVQAKYAPAGCTAS